MQQQKFGKSNLKFSDLRVTGALCFLLLSIQGSFAQQNVNYRANIVSPLINEGGTVTFRLRAPLARTVTVNGDWKANGGVGQMTKDTDGTWSYTTGKLSSDFYLYSFAELYVAIHSASI